MKGNSAEYGGNGGYTYRDVPVSKSGWLAEDEAGSHATY